MENFYAEQLAKFVGCKVSGVVTSPDGFFGLKIKSGRMENIVWFLRDDEGNGPGSCEVQAVK